MAKTTIEEIKRTYKALAFNDFTFWSGFACVILLFTSYMLFNFQTYPDESIFNLNPLGYITLIVGILIGGMCVFRLNNLYKTYSKLIAKYK
ncbi:hypothetical protein [Psychromonas sp. Urea-02u-13]|uniref:hypothetical protein n=1 Tax=Psychromonas sp. Urea-02u-13 TaxID=2058326 RepID=UPI000C31DEEE|nr:hypothetical protein [Psychromonas sp. Urea-02u-13]PKG37332.1 hypothetical protein CXF74_19380 [Psychromonas sp. Urea-02u-13]